MKYWVKVIHVVFCLFISSTHVKANGEIVCSPKEGGFVGGNSFILCDFPYPLNYATLSKIYGPRKITVVTVAPNDTAIFYEDSDGMDYRRRVKTSSHMRKGVVSFKLFFTRARDSGLYEVSYKTQHDIIDQKTYVNLTLFVSSTISGPGYSTWQAPATPSSNPPSTYHSRNPSNSKERSETLLPIVVVLVVILLLL